MRRFCFLMGVLLVCSCGQTVRPDRRTRELLSELDGYVQAREMYVTRKQDQMSALTRLAQETKDPLRRFDLEMDIAKEYFSFSFDSTQTYLKHCVQLAGADAVRAQQAAILLGHLYAKAGNYMEAYTLLYEQIDTNILPTDLKTDYLLALYDFSRDLSGNSGMVEKLSIPPSAPYRERLLQLLPENSEDWRVLLRDKFMDEDRLSSADSVANLLLSSLKEEDRSYAVHAFYKSEIAERSGWPEERLHYLVRSAESDIMNAVRDYASLTMVAQHVLPVDVDHAFHYLRVAQEDALLYNAKLRPWQISRFLMSVEDAYMARQQKVNKMVYVILYLLAFLALALSIISWFSINRTKKLARVRKELEQANSSLETANTTLNELNRQISKADQVKEEYILEFLQDMSGYITFFRTEDNRFRNLLKQGKASEVLKELSISDRSEHAREEFYETFDKTFLGMYPHFVEQFNALLLPESRLDPPKGRLCTELRIFALIRLGVDDSKQIAAMLDYSVSTIYNYKVAIKNAALGDRESFERRVKKIGK